MTKTGGVLKASEGRISARGGGEEALSRRARPSVWGGVLGVLLAVAGTALAARLELPLPGTPVPQSAQTLAVLTAGILLGPLRGGLAMACYLLAGGIGLPVFAGGGSGVEHVVGPTGGYLLGFVVAAVLAGWWVDRGLGRPVWRAVLGMMLSHASILLLGWCWLALGLGLGAAFRAGVTPFLVGALVKSVLAGGLARGAHRLRGSGPKAAVEAAAVEAGSPPDRSGVAGA